MVRPTDDLLIGVDGGTEGVRAGVFTTDGQPVCFAREPYKTDFPRAGWAEQSPEDWWQATVQAVRRAVQEAGAPPAQIRGLALGATSFSLVCADGDGRPLRPAIIWMDVRASEEAETIASSGATALRYSGGDRASAEWMLSKTLWVKRHQPEIFEATAWTADYVDWMTFRLTGEKVAALNSATIRGYYDRLLGGWPAELYEAIGAPEIRSKVRDDVLPMGTSLGGLTEQAASELGLVTSTQVAVGGADAFVGQVGLGVIAPGRMALITGSSHLQILQSDTPSYSPGLFGSYTDCVVPGEYTIEGGQASTGSVVSWFRNLCMSGGRGITADDERQFFERLAEQAATLPPGSDGLLAVPHWQGNRTPFIDAQMRGVLAGMALHHQPHHIFRAIMEGICYGTEHILRVMRGNGVPITDIVACGGALNSPLWMQIHADVSGLPIRTTKVTEAVVLGAAILAGAGSGVHPSMADAVGAMVHTDRTVTPDPDAHERYRELVDQYVDLATTTRENVHTLARSQEGQS